MKINFPKRPSFFDPITLKALRPLKTLSILFLLPLIFLAFNKIDQENEVIKYKTEYDDLLDYEKNTITVFDNTNQSVVNVTNIQLARTWAYGTVEVPRGAGSGFIWDSTGHIVTNYHVVEGGDNFLISFHKDQKQYRAKLVGVAPRKDIAVLKLIEKPANLTPLQVGISKDLRVGQKTVAIGNPFGLDHTVTTGIVSALERKIDGIGGVKIYGMIQTDASINPGNSGGPLLDSHGRLIGMNTVIFSKSGSSAGVGFAVPADTISQYVPQLIRYGKVIRPGLGISILPDNIKENFQLPQGLVIANVIEGGPAHHAGLKGMGQDRLGRYYLGDIILAIDNKPTNNFDDLYNILDNYNIGDNVDVSYLREGKKLLTKMKLMPLNE